MSLLRLSRAFLQYSSLGSALKIRSVTGYGMLLMMMFLAVGCTSGEEETTEKQYNGVDNAVEIAVGSIDVLDPVSAMITSSTDEIQIGEFSVDPGGGPVGTIHRIHVEIIEEYAAAVSRASVRTSSGDRGEDEYDLDQDSVGAGLWVLDIQSVGEEGEVRTDILTVRLWEETE